MTEFIEKVISLWEKRDDIIVLDWDSINWRFKKVEDIRKAKKADVWYCRAAGFEIELGDYVVEFEDESYFIRPIELLTECDTILVKELKF